MGGPSGQAEDVDTERLIVMNLGGGDMCDQTNMTGAEYTDLPLDAGFGAGWPATLAQGLVARGQAYPGPCLHVIRGWLLLASYWRAGLWAA